MSESRLLSTRIEPGGTRLSVDDAELRVVAGPDRGATVALGTTALVLGSASDCGLVLHDRTVSSRHAEIRIERDGYVIRDLGSKNGTLLGGFRIERAPLADRMRLRLGKSDCGLVLHDRTVSSRHAEIRIERDGYVIRDLGSKNGTLLGGFRIDRAPLADRMRLRLGKSDVVVRALGSTAGIALARAGDAANLVAHSLKMRALVAALAQLATSDTTVLVEGETGSGKEVAAHALHALGPRASGPFVVFDCSAVSPTLVTAELFGHARGAFSGADSRRDGLFVEADGGTLLIDEIGELPLDAQPALLRVIETRKVRPIGADSERRCDVRVVAATNRNLGEEVRAGRFRKDLYYRLAVARVQVPPLRERLDDLPHLARRFAEELGAPLSPELLAVLSSHEWPGNVRELRNVIARLAAQPDVLPAFADAKAAPRDPIFDRQSLRPLADARQRAGDDFERRYLVAALERAAGNVSRAAELAGVSRQMLTRLLAKHSLRARDRDP